MERVSFVDAWRNSRSFYDAYIQKNMQMLHLLSQTELKGKKCHLRFISNQIDKKLECVGRDLGTREFRDFRCVKVTPQKCSCPRECAELLERALAELSFSYAEERIYDDNVVVL